MIKGIYFILLLMSGINVAYVINYEIIIINKRTDKRIKNNIYKGKIISYR